ncbi:Rho termination factor N-terminal domain-containing protein [Nodosilinea sp. LEGE 07088]|uniref:Rho termination factor N-terminal domain-containing protein n=1 Tax=Nodosilinea sp. LEGE 07088 TaxID=2777968 RepID=UPI0018819B2D|nr:Rho termination factor N-terminal domain-containing protein [Nodosilinea sp. LEGE 07088]MBE9137966.1 Rho termination factor N-terminal domain-containing protein [Nodosilinea sp. LEGE 07088]
MSLSDVGNLMCLPFDEIQPGQPTKAHEYLIQSAANQLGLEGRNWIPLVVKEIGPDQYQVIGNSFVYAVAVEAELEEVWCIIADDTPETVAITQALAQETQPKTNLSTASREEISVAVDYLLAQPSTPLKGVNSASLVTRLDEAPRKYWKNLQPITKLGCRITAGKKLKALEQVFYLTPEPMPDVVTDRTLLESLTTAQLKAMAKKRDIEGISKLKKSDLVNLLAAA